MYIFWEKIPQRFDNGEKNFIMKHYLSFLFEHNFICVVKLNFTMFDLKVVNEKTPPHNYAASFCTLIRRERQTYITLLLLLSHNGD